MSKANIKDNLPTRFLIGTQRAGSTYLFNLLKNHSDTSLSPAQQVNFYLQSYSKGLRNYLDHFEGGGIKIDTSPKYFMKGDVVAPRIKETVGERNVRFLLILRNPVDYVRSHFQLHWKNGYLKSHPEKYPELPESENLVEFIKMYPGYLERAHYGQILERSWFSHFGRQQFRIIEFERFINKTEAVLNEILDFFDLPYQNLNTSFKSRNATLRWPIIYVLRNFLIRHPFLKNMVKKTPMFNFIYKHFLTTTQSNPLDPDERSWLAGQLENEVFLLRKRTGLSFNRWDDFNP